MFYAQSNHYGYITGRLRTANRLCTVLRRLIAVLVERKAEEHCPRRKVMVSNEGKRDRDRQTETDGQRETERETDRQGRRQTDRQAGGQGDR